MAKRNDTPRSFRFSDEELTLLDKEAAKHGNAKRALMAGLRSLAARPRPTNAELLAMLADRLPRDAKP